MMKFSPKSSPTGQIIPDGNHWDGTRLVKSYKGSKRPEHIPSDFWRMLSPKEREKLVAEEAEKFAGSSGSGAPSSSSAKASKKKKKPEPATVARQLRVNPNLSGEPKTAAVCWEVIPEGRPRFCVPAMPKAAPAKAELHRPELRELIKNKIRELEFNVALELFGAVARPVPKNEVAKNPKAKAALDKEWENLRTKGVWDESRVRECKSIVDEARKSGQTVHLGRIFEACYEKGSELPPDDPRRKFKGRTVFQGNNVRDQDSDHALFAELGSSPASMEAAKLLDAFRSQPGLQVDANEHEGPSVGKAKASYAAPKAKPVLAPKAAPAASAPQAAVTGVPSPENVEAGTVRPLHQRGQVESYRYRLDENVRGEVSEHTVIDSHSCELITKTCWEMYRAKDLRWPWRLGQHVTKVDAITRGQPGRSTSHFDQNMWMELEDLIKEFNSMLPKKVTPPTVEELIALLSYDNKCRFEFRCVAGLQLATRKGLAFCPFKIRAVQGHSERAVQKAAASETFNATFWFLLEEAHQRCQRFP